MPVDTTALLDERAITELESLGGGVLADVVTLYLSEAAKQLAELRADCDRGEMLRLAQTAHRFKGGSAAAGAARVSHIAHELEAAALAGDRPALSGLLARLSRGLEETRDALHVRIAPARSTPTRGPT
jgi:HPt (histidine-containing phosphotransfer) domain-containing protein